LLCSEKIGQTAQQLDRQHKKSDGQNKNWTDSEIVIFIFQKLGRKQQKLDGCKKTDPFFACSCKCGFKVIFTTLLTIK
jgi:hypothetical protein